MLIEISHYFMEKEESLASSIGERVFMDMHVDYYE